MSAIVNSAAGARFEKLDAQGNPLPAESLDHAILIDRQLGLYIDVRKRNEVPHKKAMAECGKVALLGIKWRSATVREAFAIGDIENQEKAFPKSLFPHFPQYAWIWTSTPYARETDAARPVFAWCVSSSNGVANYGNRLNVGLALPVSPLASSPGQ